MRNITLGSPDIGLQELNNKMPSYYLRKLRDRISPRLVGARAPSKPVDPGKRRRTSRSGAGISTDTPNSTQQDTNTGLEDADVFNGLNDSILQRISDLETSPDSHSVEPTGNVDRADEGSNASNHRRISEEIYDSPDAVNERIRRIHVDMDRLRSLENDTNWKQNINKYYNAVMDAQESLTRSVVLNGMSGQFRDMLVDISTEANKIKDDLVNSGMADSATGARPRAATLEPSSHPRTFSSTYAQRLEARRVADSYVPNHNQRSQAGTNESMPGFNGWSQDSDTQTVINRFAERLSEVESTIDKAKIELRTNTETIMTEAQSLKRQVSNTRKGNESNKEAFGKDIAKVETSIMNIVNRLTKVEGPIASIGGMETRLGKVEGEVKEVTRLVKAVPRDIDNAINGLRQELISRFSRDPLGDPHHDAPMGARGGDRPPDMEIAELKRHVTNEQIKMEDRMIKVEDKVKAMEFDLQGLASSTKSVRKGMFDMRKDIDSTLHVRQTSTPIQHEQVSHGDSTMSQLGNQFSRRTLERMIVQINKIIDDHPLTEVDIFTLKKMHSIETPKLQKLTDGFSKRIQESCKADAIDDELYERCLSATDAADSWITSIEELCNRMDIHAINSDKHKATSDLMRFTGDHRQTIYEFIEDFETEYIGVGNSKSRANIMYKKYLSQFITTKTLSLSNDYSALKAWLIDTFGDIVTIVDLLVTSLEACKTPSNDSTSDRLEFFLAISNVFVRLDRLAETPGVSSGKLEEHMSSRTIMGRLLAILPTNDEMRLIELLRENNLETRKIQGPYALDVFKNFIIARLDDLQRIAEKGARRPPALNKQKHKTTNGAAGSRLESDSSSESDENFGHKSTMGAATASPQWWRSGLSFPCPMVGHDHELGTCVDFFTLKPTQRKARLNKANRRLCWSCLKPATKCDRKCVQNVTMSEVIKCKDCAPYAASKGFACLSVLFCTNIEHNKSRPPPSLLIKELKKYLKVMSPGVTDKTIVYVNSTFLSVNTAKTSDNRKSKTRRPDPQDDCTPIDTQSGTRDHNADISIQKQSRDDAFFLMQWIKIGSSDCMVFFDRGSNVNLIDGRLAESEKLEVISQKPSTLKVVGGEDVSTEYGTYKLTLGSNKSGKYHEIICHGMPQVTTSFNKYPLNEINQEVRSNTSIIDECEPLPAAVGGSVAHLLIGIKDVDLDPTHLATLTSGVGVYRSPFKDIYGSDICYAGPHPSFSKTNCFSGNQATLASMSAHVQENRDSIYEAIMAEHSVATDVYLAMKGPLTTELNPSPLSSQDFTDLGCKVEEAQLEELGPKVNESYSTLAGHWCYVNKAIIPISKMRELLDQDDIDDVISYRCPDCSKCLTCKRSSKNTATSIQNSVEQLAIEKSVHVNWDNCEVWVDLPFIQDPDAFLMKMHRGPDNYTQALKVYQTQCRKSDDIKESVREVHKDLVKSGFLVKVTDLTQEQQELIQGGTFRHYPPWRTMGKPDSVSTKVRLVVDPTMSGLNQCLPKGENKLGSINDILIRNRASKYAWATDISKMYNQLKLNPEYYRYQLMLFHESLDPSVPPEVWAMVTAWYGVINSGGQAGEAITQLQEGCKKDHPDMVDPLTKSRYVDDCGPGANSKEQREAQIKDTKATLGKGGFKMKFIVRSGEPPCEKASEDGETVKLLGYKYAPERDIISPGFAELNMNKKVRGVRKPNEVPVTTLEEAKRLLATSKITRKVVLSKLAEFYDPIGLFEPLKLQFKLGLSALNQFTFDEALPLDLQAEWREALATLTQLSSLVIPRSVIPIDSPTDAPIRLICLSDAGESAGGAVVYAGVKLPDGTYSCGLLASKSRLLSATVPRNELSAIMTMTELVFIIKRAIGDRVEEIIYCTDSMIALSWCHNTAIKLRMFVYNRVETIRRLIQWTTETEELPLFHIEGAMNGFADLLTKRHHVTMNDVTMGSLWQKGHDWMKLPTEELPLTPYKAIAVPPEKLPQIDKECYDEAFFLRSSHVLIQRETKVAQENEEENMFSQQVISVARDPPILDLIGFGWFRSLRILGNAYRFIKNTLHSISIRKGMHTSDCTLCKSVSESEQQSFFLDMAEKSLFRHETRHILKIIPKTKRVSFQMQDDILWFAGRLSAENPFRFKDLDSVPFLDADEIGGVVPVALVDSPICFSYLMAIHTKILPHAGVVTTTRELAKRMMVPNGAKRLISRIRSDCVRCKIILKKTVELEMQKHGAPRTMVAPPFYNSMMDIAYGFPGQPFKNARKRVEVYALVIVCLFTGATSILALEGLETQDVVHAIERHSWRHGVPAEIFIDNGTQLKAMKHAKFSVRDIDAQVFDNIGLKISVSNAKSHEERGRVERRIGLIRVMLERMTVTVMVSQTALQWETLFAKIANTIDDLPLARGDTTNRTDIGYEILTANRVKLGRNNQRSLVGSGLSLDMTSNLTRILEKNRQIYKAWYQLFMDQIHMITMKPPKWQVTGRLPEVGDIVLFTYLDSGYGKKDKVWKLGKITKSGKTKVEIVFYPHSGKTKAKCSTLERNPREVSILFSLDELCVNSKEYFQKVSE